MKGYETKYKQLKSDYDKILQKLNVKDNSIDTIIFTIQQYNLKLS